MTQNKNYSMARSPRKRRPRLDNVTKGLLVAFAVAGILLAYFGGKFVFNLVKGWSLTSLPGAPVESSSDTVVQQTAQPTQALQTGGSTTTKAWDGESRVNILLLGLDTGNGVNTADRDGPPKSDTMILVTIDPLSQTIGALSIRRDLLVSIPEGVGEKKINMAYAYGEAWNLPGGGPGLAVETVEQFLGVPINYYAQIDFDSFTKLIDEIGGISITLTSPMLADWKGDGNRFVIEPGTYTVPGSYALAYARCREDCGDDQGDFGRGSRQMQMVEAVRDRIMDFNMLPTLITKAPALYNDVSADIQTDMSLTQAIQLATLMMQIPRENMTTYNIDTTDIAEQTTVIIDNTAQQVLIPDQAAIEKLVNQMFAAKGSAAAPIVMGVTDPLELAKAENARIQIMNGTLSSGLADTTSAFFTSKGLNVVGTGNTSSVLYSNIEVDGKAPYTAKYLANLMSIPTARIVEHYDANAAADIILYLGEDWANSNPMGNQ